MILHILLLILKIIGIAFVVLLGLCLLLIGILLFVPVRYQVFFSFPGTVESVKADAKISWLCRIFRMHLLVEGKETDICVKAAWKTIFSTKEQREDKEEQEDQEDLLKILEANENSLAPADVTSAEVQKTNSVDRECADVEDQKTNSVDSECADVEIQKTNSVDTDHADDRQEQYSEKIQDEPRHKAKGRRKRRRGYFRRKILEVWNKIKKFWEKIKYTITGICDKIEVFIEKKDHLTEFLTQEEHQKAFVIGIDELRRILHVLKPKEVHGKLRFGFSDPYLTGKALACLGFLYPFWGDSVEIVPEFEEQVLEGEIFLKGKIRFGTFVRTAIRLLISREIRITIRDIRRFRW